MKTKIPVGDYSITLKHHSNQQEGTFVATITEGEHKGKSFPLRCCPERNKNEKENTESNLGIVSADVEMGFRNESQESWAVGFHS